MQNAFLSRKPIAPGVFCSVIPNVPYKTNYLSIHFLLPLTEENAAKTAILSHLITDAAARYPDIQSIRRKQSALYNAQISAQTSALGETQIFSLSASFLKDRYALEAESITAELLDFCREILRAPYLKNGGFDPALYALAVKNAVADALATLNDKFFYSRRRLVETMFGSQAFAVDPLGTPERLNACDPKELYAFFETMLKTARVEALFAGEAEKAVLESSLNACFAGLDRTVRELAPCVPKEAREKVLDQTETLSINQAHLCLGLTTPITRTHPDYYAFCVANTVFGASPTSKLFMNVREKLSLCYRTNSTFEAQKGFLAIYAGIEAQNRAKAQDEILRQLAEMHRGAIEPDEITNAKNVLANAYRTYTDSPESAILWALPRILCGIEPDPERELDAIFRADKDDLVRAFSTLKPDTIYFLCGGAQ